MRVFWLLLLAGLAHADSSIPNPPKAAWQDRCAAQLRQAQRDLAHDFPEFSVGKITLEGRSVRWEANVPDAEHGRFYNGAPAHYWALIVEKPSEKPGEIGSTIGNARDSQASAGMKRWTTVRSGEIDVQIANGARVIRFYQLFDPTLTACLK
jgi:hypothetical protein